MTITEVAYCTREDVQRALSIADVPRLNARIDDAVMSGARNVESTLHRLFYPETKTVKFDQPRGARLWLYENELASAPTSILSGTQTMTIDTDVFLRPKSGPPYRWLEVSYGGTVFWQSTNTPQNAITITGDYHWPVNQVTATTLAAGVTAGASTLSLSDSSLVGVGRLILVDSERMIVSDKTMSATGATLGADLNNSKATVSVTVSDGTKISPGELILIDSERMQVEYVVGNTVTVDRAVNASALATHTTGATIYAPRTASVLRGKFGTTAASHSLGATVSLLKAPSLVCELNLAYAINNEETALSAYARTATPDMVNRYKDRGLGVMDLENQTIQAYGRKARGRAV